MALPPALLAVSRSLPIPLQALPHVPDLVSSFLLPPTIDSAVYNRLVRVTRGYEASRPFTVGAMDGAAALGHLDIVQRLHSNRSEGCSNAAFIGAATNQHLSTLQWLYDFYPQCANPAKEIVVSAAQGHVSVVEFLESKLRREQVEPSLEAAAENGHVAVLEALLRRPYSMRKAFAAAAASGQTEVVQYLLARGFNDRYIHVNVGLVKAAQGGHCDVVELLLKWSDAYTISEALCIAAEGGWARVVWLILERCELSKVSVARALEKAAERDRDVVVKMLLDDFAQDSSNRSGDSGGQGISNLRSVNSIIELSFISAVEHGRINIVKLLVDAVSRPIGDILLSAASFNQLEIMEFLLDFCEEKHLKGASFNEGVTSAIEAVASRGLFEMAKMLVAKCAIMNTGVALRMAVKNNHAEMLKILVKKSSASSLGDAVMTAAVMDRMETLEILLENSGTDVIEQALIRVASTGRDKISALLLEKCKRQAYSRIFEKAAGHGFVGLVQLLLDKMNMQSIRCGLISATMSGHSEVVSLLMDGSDSCGITCAFEMAVLKGNIGIVELLRDRCDADSLQFAILAGDPDVVHLLRNKRSRLE